MGESYLIASSELQSSIDSKSVRLRFDSPILLLTAQGLELTYKAWLSHKGFTLNDLQKIGHDIFKARRESLSNGLLFDESKIKRKWLLDSSENLEFSFEHYVHLLSRLHNSKPYVLRYQRSHIRSPVDVKFLNFVGLRLNKFIQRDCNSAFKIAARK